MKTFTAIKGSILLLGMICFGIYGCMEEQIAPPENDIEKSAVTMEVQPAGILESGALYEILIHPAPVWNTFPQRVMMVYAHGYEDANVPLFLPNDVIEDVPIKDFIMAHGMGYASTSYRENGLVVVEGIEDIMLLRQKINEFFAANSQLLPPDYMVLVGPSEGGLITVLTIEKYPWAFDAAIATCCPIGDFYGQLQYYGDAHVLFKYFFGPSLNGINLGSPKRISKATMLAWDNESLPAAIIEVLTNDYLYNNGNKVRQFINCANIPVDISNPERTIQVILEVMHYPIKATNDILFRLGGNPYNNKSPKRMYAGSDNDRKLNLTVERIKRTGWEEAAMKVSVMFETSGELATPLITVHKLRDHITFYEHQEAYQEKVLENSPFPFLLQHFPVDDECSHCTFQLADIEQALQALSGILSPAL